MGTCAIAENDFPAGNNLILQSIQATEDTYGEDSPNVIFYMNGLAQAFMYEKQDAKAIPYLEKAIKIGERLPASAQSDVMGSLSILVLAYDHAGKIDEAESVVERLLTGMEAQFGTDSPQLLRALNEQENLLKQLGRTSDAATVEKHIDAIKTATAIANPN